MLVAVFLFRKIMTTETLFVIAVLVLFLGSTNLLFLSILSEYVSKILDETKKRPQYIIKKVLNNNNQ